MGSTAEEADALAIGTVASVQSNGQANRGVARIALTGASQTIAIAPELRGCWADLTNESVNDLQYAFGEGAAPTLVFNQLSTPGTGSAAAGQTIFTKTMLPKIIPKKATHLAVISGAAGGFFALNCSSQRVL